MQPNPAEHLIDALRRIDETTRDRPRSGVVHDGADDTHGTIASDDAIGFDPLPLLGALDRHGAQVVAMGQVAGILHGSTELTGDLDVLWSGDRAEAAAMCAGFAAVDAELTDDEQRSIPVTEASFELPKVLFRTDTAAGDCCTPALPWGRFDVPAIIARAESCEVDGVTVRYVALDDLIAMRRAVGRPKDLRRADELERLTR